MDATRAPDGLDRRVAEIAARQHGVVSLVQLRAAGLGRGAIAHRVRAGRLHPLHRGVHAVGHRRITGEGRWLAAVLACGDGAALSHASAAALWELRPSASARIDVTVASRAGRASRGGIRVHRSGTLRAADVTTHRAIPVTTLARTLFDIAETQPLPTLQRAIERAEILQLFDLRALQAVIAANPARRGTVRLLTALELYRDDEATRSDLEAFFRDLCAGHRIERPLVNAIVEGEEVDFLWRPQRLVVEADGRRTHLTRAAFERDRAKDAKLTLAGYRVVRFTYRQIEHEREATAATLLALLLRTSR